jgi:hypothetical protein
VSLKREIRILNIGPIDFFVLVKQVGVLEFLNRLMNYLRDPVIDSKTTIFHNHLLQVIEFIALIVVSFEVFN